MAQAFKAKLPSPIQKVVQTEEVSYRPLLSTVSEPIDILHCDKSIVASAFKEIGGSWARTYATAGTPSATRAYSVRLGVIPIQTLLYFFKDSKLISTYKTDTNGVAIFSLPSTSAQVADYTISLFDKLIPFKNPFQEYFRYAVWMVRCHVGNKSDLWDRFVGRSFATELEREFWGNPQHVIGLAFCGACLPEQTTQPANLKGIHPLMDSGGYYPILAKTYPNFTDFVPVFGDANVTVEYGISAYCHAGGIASPSKELCLATRPKTWWSFLVEATNGKTKQSIRADLNIDRHLRLTFTPDTVASEVVKPTGAET